MTSHFHFHHRSYPDERRLWSGPLLPRFWSLAPTNSHTLRSKSTAKRDALTANASIVGLGESILSIEEEQIAFMFPSI